MDSNEGTLIYTERVRQLMKRLEVEHFGESFGVFLHFELRLTPTKILEISQAASKTYNKLLDRYESKVLLYDPYRKHNFVNVPRVAPPCTKLKASIVSIESRLGVNASEDGRIAFKDFETVLQELLAHDPGRHLMPSLACIREQKIVVPIVIQWDGTGFGAQQFNTIAVNNPYLPKSPANLYVFGLGNCKDDKGGTLRLLGPNRAKINALVDAARQGKEAPSVGGGVHIKPWFVTDTAALRHGEHIAKSGFCGCSADKALRELPEKPETVEQMLAMLRTDCISPTALDRDIKSHSIVPGESIPRPCTGKDCKFAHNPATAMAEYVAFRAEEKRLASDTTKAGKAAFSKWRMAHADRHDNVQPGEYGEPMIRHDLDDQLLDGLHVAELNLPKVIMKYSLLENSSDDARDLMSAKLAEWNHPLDTRRKDNNRDSRAKWFTGAKFHTFCTGEGGSPGGPVAIAELTWIVAEDMRVNGTGACLPCDSASAPEKSAGQAAQPGKGGKSKSGLGRGGFFSRLDSDQKAAGKKSASDKPKADGVEHSPTALERAADPAKLQLIRKVYGSRGQTVINILLSWDGFFGWYYPFKEGVPFMCPMETRYPRALDNCRRAIDMQEIVERVSIRRHKSYLYHGAVYKMTRDILAVGNTSAMDTSALEMQNATTKRTATAQGAKRLVTTSSGQQLKPMRGVTEGPAQLVQTKGYSSTLSLSTMKKVLGAQSLRRDDAPVSIPDARRKERLMVTGRSKHKSTGVKPERAEGAIEPCKDSALNAYVRLLEAQGYGLE